MGDDVAAPANAAPTGYDPVRVLGRGRLGLVMLCRNEAGVEVAVRILGAQPADEQAQREFESELRAAAAAGSHPCAAQITRVWTDPVQGTCLEQQYCPGGSVADRLAGAGPLDPATVIVGGLRLTGALARMHNSGLLHRDVRPANVLLDGEGEWLLAEGGVAHAARRATAGAGPLHDPRYAPRELLGWEDPGPPADVYALGATLYALLEGQPPAAASTQGGATAEYAARLAGPAPLPLLVQAPLSALVLRMLAVDPADRPGLAEVDQVLRAQVPAAQLSRVPAPEPLRAVPAPPRPRTRIAVTEPDTVERAGRRRVLLAGAAVVVLFFGGAGAVVATSGDRDDAPAPLTATPSLAQPTAAPPATQVTGAPAPAPPPVTKTKATPKATPKPKPKMRGTKGTTSDNDPDVKRGVKPRQILAFNYRSRLGLLFDYDSISPEVQRFEFRSARPDGSDSRLGDFQPSDVKPDPGPRRRAYFFEPGVSVNRCVQVRVRLKSGRLVPDPRTVCTTELTDPVDLRDADSGWQSYLVKLEEERQAKENRRKAATASPTAATKPTTAARQERSA